MKMTSKTQSKKIKYLDAKDMFSIFFFLMLMPFAWQDRLIINNIGLMLFILFGMIFALIPRTMRIELR